MGGGIELENTQATLIGNVIANNAITILIGYGGGIAVNGWTGKHWQIIPLSAIRQLPSPAGRRKTT